MRHETATSFFIYTPRSLIVRSGPGLHSTMPFAQQLGRYQLLDRIAFGGMAEIFRAKTFDARGARAPGRGQARAQPPHRRRRLPRACSSTRPRSPRSCSTRTSRASTSSPSTTAARRRVLHRHGVRRRQGRAHAARPPPRAAEADRARARGLDRHGGGARAPRRAHAEGRRRAAAAHRAPRRVAVERAAARIAARSSCATSASPRRRRRACRPRPASSRARSSTCRPSRRWGASSTTAPTCSRSAP